MTTQHLRRCALALSISSILVTGCSNTQTTDAVVTDTTAASHPTDLEPINAMSGESESDSQPSEESQDSGGIEPIDQRILFAFDSSSLSHNAKASLDVVIQHMESHPGKRFRIVVDGHTDSIGSRDYNQDLSMARATSVKRYLKERTDRSAIQWQVEAHGENMPVASNSTEMGRERNRRTDILLSLAENNDS